MAWLRTKIFHSAIKRINKEFEEESEKTKHIEDEVEKDFERYSNACRLFYSADSELLSIIGSVFFTILAYIKYIAVIFIFAYYFGDIGFWFGLIIAYLMRKIDRLEMLALSDWNYIDTYNKKIDALHDIIEKKFK